MFEVTTSAGSERHVKGACVCTDPEDPNPFFAKRAKGFS